jgi:hypothetical protein
MISETIVANRNYCNLEIRSKYMMPKNLLNSTSKMQPTQTFFPPSSRAAASLSPRASASSRAYIIPNLKYSESGLTEPK